MRKGDEDWVNKFMEYRVEDRRPVGRPRKAWLECVDMAKLEIDKEDVHDRSKWRRNVKEVQPYRKTGYKPIIYNPHIEIYSILYGRCCFQRS